MASAHRTIVINRPIDEVFAFFADVTNDPKWRRHGLKEISIDGPMHSGARVRQKVTAGPFGAAVKADMDVVAYEPPRELGFQVITGPLRPRVHFAFAPSGTGTEVSFRIDAPLTGLKKAVLERTAQKSMAAEASALDDAKSLLETSPTR